MALPDFLIVGAMKCGTSTLATQLGAQQGIFMSTPKEPNFFSDDKNFARGLPWYKKHFENAPRDDLKGEASTHYTKLPTYPNTIARMCAVLEAPRIIYVIRNPVERAISHHIHMWSEGRMARDITTSIVENVELVDYGRYAMQIEPFINAYGLSRIFLTSLELLSLNPQIQLEQIGMFLEHNKPMVWREEYGVMNISAERYRPLPFQKFLVDGSVATVLRRRFIPKALRRKIRKARAFGKRPEIPGNVRRRLEMIFAEDREQLAKFFPGHPALNEAYPFVMA